MSPGKQHQPPTRAVAITCSWRVGGRHPHSGPCQRGQPGTKMPFTPLTPLPRARLNGECSDSREEMSLPPSPLWGLSQAHLPTMPDCDEGTGGLKGPSATRQQVGPVVGPQHPYKVGTLHLARRRGVGWRG